MWEVGRCGGGGWRVEVAAEGRVQTWDFKKNNRPAGRTLINELRSGNRRTAQMKGSANAPPALPRMFSAPSAAAAAAAADPQGLGWGWEVATVSKQHGGSTGSLKTKRSPAHRGTAQAALPRHSRSPVLSVGGHCFRNTENLVEAQRDSSRLFGSS